MTCRSLWILILTVALAHSAPAATIDHGHVDQTPDLPQETLDEIGGQSWFFAHASVGGNMVVGISDLHASEPGRYQLVRLSVEPGTPPPAPTAAGTVYESYRGNPGWAEKYVQFEESVRVEGWHWPAVDVVMNKLCYDDDRADVDAYLASMAALESDFAETIFVYATMPLRAGASEFNVRINRFNETVRAYCTANELTLFDIADIEAHDPDGNEITFESGGEVFQMLNADYTYDGGHLNEVGRERASLGWYAVAAAIQDKDLAAVDLAPAMIAGIESVSPNPFNPATVVRWSVAADTQVHLSVVDLRGRLVQRLFDGPATAGVHETHWRGVDDTARPVGAGVYLLRLEAGGQVTSRPMSLVR